MFYEYFVISMPMLGTFVHASIFIDQAAAYTCEYYQCNHNSQSGNSKSQHWPSIICNR